MHGVSGGISSYTVDDTNFKERNMENIIIVNNLVKKYSDVTAVNGVSFSDHHGGDD
jgi:hypothetical protein